MSAGRIQLLLASVALLVGGCASVPRQAGFGDVERAIAERTGQRVHWNQGTASDQAVDAQVRAMLQKELAADEAVQIALLSNRGLQATYEDLSIAQADLVSAGLLRNPVFDAQVRFGTAGGGTGLDLGLVQDFIDLLYIPLRKRMAGAAFEAAKLRVTGLVMDLAGETRAAFHTFQAAQQTLEMRRQVLAATEASYDIARRLREAGNTRDLDLFTEQALYEQSKLDVRAAEAQVVQDREQLNEHMGLWAEAAAAWTAVPRLPDLPPQEPVLDDLERRAVERSLDLQASRQQIAMAGRSLGLAAPFGLLPEAEVGAVAEREPEGGWSVGPAFALPIPLFNQGQPAFAAAQAELRRARQRYAAMAVSLRARARAAGDAVIAARDQAEYYRRVILPLRGKIVEQTQLQYNAMQVSPLELLRAKQQQIDTGATYIRSLRAYWLARTELDQLLSGRMASFARGPMDASENSSSPAGGRGGH